MGLSRLRSFASAITSLRKIFARGDEDGQRLGIVLGLRDEIGRDAGRGAAFAGDDDLRGPGQHVDGAVEGDETLGRGDVEIAGANDLVDARNSLLFRRPARRRRARRRGDRTR